MATSTRPQLTDWISSVGDTGPRQTSGYFLPPPT
jgi:hypothetical protein